MRVIEQTSICTTACTPATDTTPGCGCAPKSSLDSKLTGAAATSAMSAVACTSCCVLPLVLPAVVMANIGGAIAVLDHAHVWVTRLAMVVLALAWGVTIRQAVKNRTWPARTAIALLVASTVLTTTAASWKWIEPAAFQMFGIVKKQKAQAGAGEYLLRVDDAGRMV